MKNKKTIAKLRIQLERRHPSAFLLFIQLVSLVLYAAFDGRTSEREIVSALGGIALVLVVWVVNRSPSANWFAWMLAVPAFILSILSAILTNQTLLIWSSLLEAVLYFYAASSLIFYMMNDDKVTTDELFAAGATFTLIAWGFAYTYVVCQAILPGSFVNSSQPEIPITFVQYLFLSFTNLSATGLGDIMPVNSFGRVLVMLEQFSGVGYVTIVVSRLIGLTITTKNRKQVK